MTDNNKKSTQTDFNDLHRVAGLDVVRDQLFAALAAGPYRAPDAMNDAEPPPFDDIPLEAYEGDLSLNHAADVRKPMLGEETVPEAVTVAFTLDSVLERFHFADPSGKIWDSERRIYLKKVPFRELIGKRLADDWLASADRKIVQDDAIQSFFVEQQAAAVALMPVRKRSWKDLMHYTDSGEPKSDIYNAKLVLDNDDGWQGVVGYCDFSYRIMKRKRPPFANSEPGEWTDTDTDRLRIWLSEKYGFTPKNADALGAVVVAAEANRFHPVRDYLQGLQWDGKLRVHAWLSTYLGAEQTLYSSLVAQMWMIGAVVRVMRPPVKVDNVLIFEGLQGLGKSTTLSILGGEWFTDTPLALGDKDGYQQMQGVWIIELAELDSLNKVESTRAKQFFASSVDKYRPSYGRMVQTFPRQCVFAGTTNQDHYFKDATGNRRYWPVSCSYVDADGLRRDRDQLWAEAFHMFNRGDNWWPADEHKDLFGQQQDERFDEDVWQELIQKYLAGLTADRVLQSDIMSEALGMQAAQMKPPEQKRVGQIMVRLGWKKKKVRIDGERPAAYFPPDGWQDRFKAAPDNNSATFESPQF